MTPRRSRSRGRLFWSLAALAGLAGAAAAAVAVVWRDDILQAFLDPKVPFAVYKPPKAPDYARADAWVLLPGPAQPTDPPADIFFIHPTTFDGGRNWNGPMEDAGTNRLLNRVMLPNYAAPFAGVGRVFAPRYRQASLYTTLTLFDDAIEAREFAYGDVHAAFESFLQRAGPDRPFVIVGVEQGGLLAARLLREDVTGSSSLRRRLIGAYLMETAVPAPDFRPGSAAVPACASRAEAGCVIAWISAPWIDFGKTQRIMNRSLAWNDKGHLTGLGGRQPLCVNPLLGAAIDDDAPARLNLGAANATGLEWGARPGLMARQVGAQCVDGILRISSPRSSLLRPQGGWPRRLRVADYNLFWADLEADVRERAGTWLADHPGALSPSP